MKVKKDKQLKISRRTFIGSAVSYMTFAPLVASARETSVQIAIQLFSVRDAAQADLPGTLQRLSEIGYKGVELAGTYGYSAHELKRMLEDAHLECVGSHISMSDLLGSRFDSVVEFNKLIGNRNLIVAGGLAYPLGSMGGNRFTAYFFTHLAKKAEDVGLRIGLHSHSGDFVDMGDGFTAWDHFFRETDPNVIAELDVGNCFDDHADPYLAIQRSAGRNGLIHIKASSPDGTLLGGEGDEIDWSRIFQMCETVGSTKYYIIEQENNKFGLSSIEAALRCFEKMKEWGK